MKKRSVSTKSPRRGKPSYVTAVLMITLLLFIMGMVGMIFIHFRELTRIASEQIELRIQLREPGKEIDYIQFQKKLEAEAFVKSAEYISKATALELHRTNNPEQYRLDEELLGDLVENNPFPPLIAVRLQEDYVNPDSVAVIKQQLISQHQSLVEHIGSNEEQIEGLFNWKNRALLIMGALSLALLIAVIVMLDSTIRLAMYSNRFLVKSMQLVGARRSFITRPYVRISIVNGLVGACLAIALVLITVMALQSWYEDLRQLENYGLWGLLFAAMIGLGILISWWSTHHAVTKYLKLKLDELY